LLSFTLPLLSVYRCFSDLDSRRIQPSLSRAGAGKVLERSGYGRRCLGYLYTFREIEIDYTGLVVILVTSGPVPRRAKKLCGPISHPKRVIPLLVPGSALYAPAVR
jgi:hypothetical protein